MKQIQIEGGKPLNGKIKISGAKNSAVALIPASILSDKITKIYNIPEISDIKYLIEILELLNVKVIKEKNQLTIDSRKMINKPIPLELAGKLRASYYFMGSLLAKFGEVTISFPGGCDIGKRPIDIHLFGFRKLNAEIKEEKEKIIIKTKKLTGNNIYLDFASVGATINIMLAASKANGITIIENAAKEPEIINIASFLINMGVNIQGAGTNRIKIVGRKRLKSAGIEVLPDRIEAGTYIIIGSLLGNLKITNVIPNHIYAFLLKLREMRVDFDIKNDTIITYKHKNIKPAKIKTLVYPGFPTDLQQPMAAMLTFSNGKSIIEETIYENRFQNSKELNKMEAKTYIKNGKLIIEGPTKLKGNIVEATDLRAGACLLIAALMAEGTTIIKNADYILRGYENLEDKLTKVGANIKIIE